MGAQCSSGGTRNSMQSSWSVPPLPPFHFPRSHVSCNQALPSLPLPGLPHSPAHPCRLFLSYTGRMLHHVRPICLATSRTAAAFSSPAGSCSPLRHGSSPQGATRTWSSSPRSAALSSAACLVMRKVADPRLCAFPQYNRGKWGQYILKVSGTLFCLVAVFTLSASADPRKNPASCPMSSVHRSHSFFSFAAGRSSQPPLPICPSLLAVSCAAPLLALFTSNRSFPPLARWRAA